MAGHPLLPEAVIRPRCPRAPALLAALLASCAGPSTEAPTPRSALSLDVAGDPTAHPTTRPLSVAVGGPPGAVVRLSLDETPLGEPVALGLLGGVTRAIDLPAGVHALTVSGTWLGRGLAPVSVEVVGDAPPTVQGLAVRPARVAPGGTACVTADAVSDDGEATPTLWGRWTLPDGEVVEGRCLTVPHDAAPDAITVAAGADDGLQAPVLLEAPLALAPDAAPPLAPWSLEGPYDARGDAPCPPPEGAGVGAERTWYVEGLRQGPGEDPLPPGAARRDQEVACLVHWPTVDGEEGSWSTAAVAVNSPPTLTVRMTPDTPRDGDAVACVLSATDPDGDALDTTGPILTVDGQPADPGVVVDAGAVVRCDGNTSDDRSPRLSRQVSRTVLADRPPGNVLVIVADDLGLYDTPLGRDPERAVPPMPHLAALADEGLSFDHAWSQPVCAPTRASLLTGRDPAVHGIGGAVSPGKNDPELEGFTTVAQWLADAPAAYTTALVGKWHVGRTGAHVLASGFDHYEGNLANLDASTDGLPQSWHSYEWFSDAEHGRRIGTYLTTAEADAAIDFVQTLPEPWFVVLAFHAPHLPFHVPPEELLSGPAPAASAPVRPKWTAMVEAMDTEMGRVLEEVAPEDTVVFLGDNGTPRYAGLAPWSGERIKGSGHEGAVRVPLVVRSPWVHTPGSVSDALVHVNDLFPTLAAMADHPADPLQLDGHDLLGVIADPLRPLGPRTALYSESFTPHDVPVDQANTRREMVFDGVLRAHRRTGEPPWCSTMVDDGWREGPNLRGTPEEPPACGALVDILDARRLP